MFFVKIYFILGLAMFLVVIWDYKYLSNTANRLLKQPDNKSGFSLIVLSVRNLMVMAIFAFFLWPLVVVLELSGKNVK
jgi:hypothetical protein